MKRELALWGAFVVAIAALPWIGVSGDRYLMFLANVMLMFMTLALSWDIVARTGQLSLAHGAFFGLGAYGVAIAYRSWHLPPLAGIVVAALATGIIAIGLGVVTLRLRGIYFAIATLAFAEVLRTVALQLPELTGGNVGIAMPPLFEGDRVLSYYLIAAIFVLTLAASIWVRRSRLQYAVTAIRANEAVAAVMGVSVVRTKVALFALSATLAALAGAFYMPFITHTDPADAFDISRSVSSLVFPIFCSCPAAWSGSRATACGGHRGASRGNGSRPPVPRSRRRRWPLVHRRARANARDHRSERGGEVDGVQPRLGIAAPARRDHPPRRA